MKIGIAMMSHETNTFSPVITDLDRFSAGAGEPLRGEAALEVSAANAQDAPATTRSAYHPDPDKLPLLPYAIHKSLAGIEIPHRETTSARSLPQDFVTPSIFVRALGHRCLAANVVRHLIALSGRALVSHCVTA